ncbi:HEAT repeat domain-containing protein [Streptomyces sp. TR02-1]|uniref:HEAT repeat domain-containing protein n=1 Tax=Streptomyces sp. TR02-1 TaxID=3385977 RepID=UPI0039A26DDB
MYVDPVDSDIAPSGTLLGLLQRGRGDGTLHALAAPRNEALAALARCVCSDPRRDWRIENRSLYYARLHVELGADLDAVEAHLFHPEDTLAEVPEERTGLALSVLGHLVSYGDTRALHLLRRYTTTGAAWQWALDELAVRDDDAGLVPLGPRVLARFPQSAEGEAGLAAAAKDAFEPRPWRLWEEDATRPEQGERLRKARETVSFDRWQRQLRANAPRPGWSVREVLAWAQEEWTPRREAAAARCLAAVAGPADRTELLAVARGGPDAARGAALRHLAEHADPAVLDLLQDVADETAVSASPPPLLESALASFFRMRSSEAVRRARRWAARREDALGRTAAHLLARDGGPQDAGTVLTALRRTVRDHGADSDDLWPLVDGAGRLTIRCAAPVLRHLYRETASSRLRGRTARALAATDDTFAAGFAVECLWDCEETTRELAARYAAIGDSQVVERFRRLAADPAEEAGVQDAVRVRLEPDGTA